jgi:transcriptional regulator with XRE-family HTH domain
VPQAQQHQRASNAAIMSLTHTLQSARKTRRWSQLELATRMGVSQRHISFVESGRARPSREMLLAWMRELGAPLDIRNAALTQAGFAPVYALHDLQHESLAPAQAALMHLLAAHDPMPAMILDAHWNVVQLNRGAQWLALTLMPWLADQMRSGKAINLLDAMIHPQGMCSQLSNLAEVAPALLAILRDDAVAHPTLKPRVDQIADWFHTRLGAAALRAVPTQLAPMLCSRFQTPYGELAFFSLFTTFGSPQQITLASLRVEHLCPVDAHTRSVLVCRAA